MGNSYTLPEVDLTGKVVVITGANTGLGYTTALEIAR
jgi:NAD(P)-dependent dehydrogenase (short-subunit alcohol dehydrogenase family)